MKKTILFGISTLMIPSVLADYGPMMDSGYGMGGSIGMGLYGIIWFILITFIFSVIFWSTYKWILKSKTKRR